MSQIILHNYPQSPVAEKVRVGLGILGLKWASVEIPRIPPKPMLTKLTGGYRRTPVMQIGADIYCDSQCILQELDQRFGTPTLFPERDAGLICALSRWVDGDLFDLTVKIVLGASADALPQDFAEDRGRLYLGANWAQELKQAGAQTPHHAAQMRGPLRWLEQQLGDGRPFLMGDSATAIDAQFYHLVWFLRGRWAQGPAFLSEFPKLEAWETRLADIGHGEMSDLGAEDAILEATKAEPSGVTQSDPLDPQGLTAGMQVSVSPDVDGGEQPVEGALVAASTTRLTIARSEGDLGTVHVHFPRIGYRISALA